MQLVNETDLDCHLSRLQLFFQDLLQALVVVKGSFDVLPSGEVKPAAEPSPVLLEDTETAHGTLEAEVVPAKAWCDLAVLGHAYNPGGAKPADAMIVSLQIGAFKRSMRVCGDRAWIPTLRGLRPSRTVPFAKVPLGRQRAYGGAARQKEDLEMSFADNPDGVGYVVLEEHAAGTPLPNVEEIDQPVRAWTDHPLPAGMGPLGRGSMLRAQRGMTVDLERQVARIDSSAFCFAHPRMTLPSYPDGATVKLRGASADGRWSFRLPSFRYWITVELGASRYRLPLQADTLYLLPDERRITVVARRAFIYQFLPQRLRTIRVTAQPDAGAAEPTATLRGLRANPDPEIPVLVEPSRALELPLQELVDAHPMIDLIQSLPVCASG